MSYPSRSWTSFPGIAVHWIEMAILTTLYVVGRQLLGFDPAVDWTLWGTIVLLGTLVHLLVWTYGRPRRAPSSASRR